MSPSALRACQGECEGEPLQRVSAGPLKRRLPLSMPAGVKEGTLAAALILRGAAKNPAPDGRKESCILLAALHSWFCQLGRNKTVIAFRAHEKALVLTGACRICIQDLLPCTIQKMETQQRLTSTAGEQHKWDLAAAATFQRAVLGQEPRPGCDPSWPHVNTLTGTKLTKHILCRSAPEEGEPFQHIQRGAQVKGSCGSCRSSFQIRCMGQEPKPQIQHIMATCPVLVEGHRAHAMLVSLWARAEGCEPHQHVQRGGQVKAAPAAAAAASSAAEEGQEPDRVRAIMPVCQVFGQGHPGKSYDQPLGAG